MKECFRKDYGETYNSKKIEKPEEADKKTLENAKKELTKLLENIENEKSIIYDIKNDSIENKDLNDLKEKINTTIYSYDEKLKKIKEEEETEAKKEAEEAERKAAEEAAAAAQKNNYSSGNQSSQSGGQNNTQQSNSSGNWKDGLRHIWENNPDTGEKIPGTDRYIDPRTGNMYDENNNYITNIWDY